MRLLGVFGHPIAHSLSPVMHQAALKAAGLEGDYAYLPFDVPPGQLGEAVKAVRILNARGINLTIPHKETVIPYLDDLDDEARAIGAVNVIVNDEGRLRGFNTDGTGFLRSVQAETGATLQGKRILLLGAGGAARAVAAALAGAKAEEIIVFNRTMDRARPVAEIALRMGVSSRPFSSFREEGKRMVKEAQVIINTTSVGLDPKDPSLLEGYDDCLHQDQLVCDIIYRPGATALLRQAKSKGCRVLAGSGMLLYQGAEAFRLWTGREAPVQMMKKALEEKS